MDNTKIFYYRSLSGHLENVTVLYSKDKQPEGTIYPLLEHNWLCNCQVKAGKQCFKAQVGDLCLKGYLSSLRGHVIAP